MGYIRTTTYILAICLLYQALSGNEGSKWIEADLIDLKDASTQNDPYAQGFLALSYAHGDKGLDLSMDKALELSQAAAGQNHWLGHFALGYLARFEPYGPNEALVRKHYLEAFQDPDARLIKAFTNNDPVASYALGEIFTSDEVRPDLVPDFTFAAKHYEKSSQGGYQPASVQYALFKQHEIVDPEMAIEKDLVQGINLLKRAAQSKLPAAYHYLGRSYFKGIGVELDQEMALVNFRAAADRGFPISQLAVAEFFAYGVAGPPKIDLAIRYARLALDQEEERAKIKIAEYERLLLEDTSDSAVIRLIPNYPKDLARLLKSQSITYTERDVLAVELQNEEAMQKVTHSLLRAEINIHYVYPFLHQPNGKPVLAMAMEDEDIAEDALKQNHLKILSQDDFAR